MSELRNKKRVQFTLLVSVMIVIIIVIVTIGQISKDAGLKKPKGARLNASINGLNNKSTSLVVPPQAKGVNYSSNAGIEQVRYELTEKYPAKYALKWINDELTKQGWKPLKDDFRNPGQPSSHVTGWTHFVDSTRKPEETVKLWQSQWSNSRGDIINYDLDYRWPWPGTGTPINPKDLCTPKTNKLQVFGIYIPAKQVKQLTPP